MLYLQLPGMKTKDYRQSKPIVYCGTEYESQRHRDTKNVLLMSSFSLIIWYVNAKKNLTNALLYVHI